MINDKPVEDSAADGGEAEHVSVYLRFKTVFGDSTHRSSTARKRNTKKEGASTPFSPGRDPHGLSDVIDGLAAKMGWMSPLARSELLGSWPEIVGHETAEHSIPAGIESGVLSVRCDSTAWATQLRLMRAQITTTIAQRYPDAGIQTVRFEGPNAPSWKSGPRSIPGRGPRDTYG
jgi:predicted nucleic acid-binding Zn ribbon protein